MALLRATILFRIFKKHIQTIKIENILEQK